jgi:hypothetical protein
LTGLTLAVRRLVVSGQTPEVLSSPRSSPKTHDDVVLEALAELTTI